MSGRQQLSDPPSAFSVHSTFSSDFPRHVLHHFDSLLLLHLFFFRRLILLALQSLQVVLSKQRENSCPAIFSPLSYYVFLLSAHPPPFQGGTSSCECLSVAFFDLVLVQDFLFHSFGQILSALVHFALAETSPFTHFFSVSSTAIFGLSFISSIDHPGTIFFSLTPFTPLPCDMRSCTTRSGTFGMTSNCKLLPSILLLSKIVSNFWSSSHCAAIWSSSRQLPSSSSFSI